MSLTTASIATMFAPLATQTPTPSLSSRYEGCAAFVGSTFARIASMVAGPLVISLEGAIVDASGESAAVMLRTVGEAKSRLKVDDRACWVVKAKDGKFVEITSYVDLAFLEKLIPENKESLDVPMAVAA